MIEEKFKYASKKEYEKEMIRMVRESKTDKQDYDDLVEEYVKFCDTLGEDDV